MKERQWLEPTDRKGNSEGDVTHQLHSWFPKFKAVEIVGRPTTTQREHLILCGWWPSRLSHIKVEVNYSGEPLFILQQFLPLTQPLASLIIIFYGLLLLLLLRPLEQSLSVAGKRKRTTSHHKSTLSINSIPGNIPFWVNSLAVILVRE